MKQSRHQDVLFFFYAQQLAILKLKEQQETTKKLNAKVTIKQKK